MTRPLAYFGLPREEHVSIPAYAMERMIRDTSHLELYGMREEDGLGYVLATSSPQMPQRLEPLLERFFIPDTHYTSSVYTGMQPSFELPEWLAERTGLGASVDVLYQLDHLAVFNHEVGSTLYRALDVDELPFNL